MHERSQWFLEAASRAPVLPVVTLDDIDFAPDLASVLLQAGLPLIEITLRTPHALDVIRAIARQVPQAVVIAGTITTPSQVGEAIDAGACALVTPGTTPRLAEALAEAAVPALPGCSSISEALALSNYGFDFVKLFPATLSGGPAFLKALHGPLPNLRFCPTGGITPESATEFLACSNVVCVGGTWVTPKKAIAGRDIKAIRALATEAAALPLGAGRSEGPPVSPPPFK